jgi:hypothetical protein
LSGIVAAVVMLNLGGNDFSIVTAILLLYLLVAFAVCLMGGSSDTLKFQQCL